MYSEEVVNSILSEVRDKFRARVAEGINQKPFTVQKIEIPLTNERLATDPFVIGFPFRSIFVQDATDVNVSVNFKPTTQDEFQSSFELKKNDSWSSDYPIPGAYLHWDAQSAKTITLVVFTEAEFRSGSQISVTGGGVSIVEGSSFTQAAVALTAATATSIFASDSTRKIGVFQNKTGASVWVGNSSVSNTTSFYEVPAGADFIWRNTAQLYGYSLAGGTVHKTEEF